MTIQTTEAPIKNENRRKDEHRKEYSKRQRYKLIRTD